MHKFVPLIGLSLFLFSCANSVRPVTEFWREPSSTGARTDEATLQFSAFVELIQKTQPKVAEARDQIEFQVQHLFGPMELGDKLGTLKAAPKEKYTLKNIKISKHASKPDTYVATYDYEGKIVVEKSPSNAIDLYLPNNPDTMWAQSKVGMKPNEHGKIESGCVDHHYTSKTEFWYFWAPAPAYPECLLKPDEHYQRLKGALTRHPARYKTTYPDYPRLVENGVVDIHLVFGKDDYRHGRLPVGSVDDAAKQYLEVRKLVENQGFTFRLWNLDEMNAVMGEDKASALRDAPYVEEAVKEYPNGKKARVRLFYGMSEFEVKGRQGFHRFLRDAVEKSAILVYDGHSGLGKSSNLKSIEDDRGNQFKFNFNKGKYQIFFFNSCSSYAYYNLQYFRRKRSKDDDGRHKGMHNLDMISNGIGTDWKTEPDFALVRAIDLYLAKNQWTSYQDLAESFDTGNLNLIEGDEDNPRKPR